MRLRITYLLIFLLLCTTTFAQKSKVEEQQKIVNSLEKKIAQDEQELEALTKQKASASKKVKVLGKQIENRNNLIKETNSKIKILEGEVTASENKINRLSNELHKLEKSFSLIARDAYLNYRFNTIYALFLTSSNFRECIDRIIMYRSAARHRENQMKKISKIRQDVTEEKISLANKKNELDKSVKKLDRQKKKLGEDLSTVKQSVKNMSKKEKQLLDDKKAQEKLLDEAIKTLRKLTKGNQQGKAFSTSTTGLRIPVSGGKVRKYKGNTAEIIGQKDAVITSIFDGKIVSVKRNKINQKYDVYIAHGEYISAYTNLSSVCVKKDDVVLRNQQIGVIASSINIETGDIEYRIMFSIHAPSSSIKMSASKLFSR